MRDALTLRAPPERLTKRQQIARLRGKLGPARFGKLARLVRTLGPLRFRHLLRARALLGPAKFHAHVRARKVRRRVRNKVTETGCIPKRHAKRRRLEHQDTT